MSILKEKIKRDIKVIQFGEGNFLRAFVDYFIDVANELGYFDGNIVIVKPTSGAINPAFDLQESTYTVKLRGLLDGKEYQENRVITSVEKSLAPEIDYEQYCELATLTTLRFVVSNTTEAGIVYNENDLYTDKYDGTFPAKLTRFLKKRFDYFKGDYSKGLIMLPVELIDNNGLVLKECVNKYIDLWQMGNDFKKWIDEACLFTATLVDRIVTGYPKGEVLEVEDNLYDAAEPFGLWVIEASKDISNEFPLDKALENKTGMKIIFTDNQAPYKQRKVRILNGAHTSFVLASYMLGHDYVKESMDDELILNFMNETIFEEIIPTLSFDKKELLEFAKNVVDRFNNPFIKHSLLAISLNSVSKWKTRCLPSLKAYYEQYHKIPQRLAFSLASLMYFYQGKVLRDNALIGLRNKEEYLIKDDLAVLDFFIENSELASFMLAEKYLANIAFHGEDLTKIVGLTAVVGYDLENIRTKGMKKALEELNETIYQD